MLHLTNQDLQEIKQLVEVKYYEAICNKEQQIKEFTLSLYGFVPCWYEKETTDIFIKIKRFMELTNTKIEGIKKEIRQYLGYTASFFTLDKDGKVPIALERIERALSLIDSRASIIQVENALYF